MEEVVAFVYNDSTVTPQQTPLRGLATAPPAQQPPSTVEEEDGGEDANNNAIHCNTAYR